MVQSCNFIVDTYATSLYSLMTHCTIYHPNLFVDRSLFVNFDPSLGKLYPFLSKQLKFIAESRSCNIILVRTRAFIL